MGNTDFKKGLLISAIVSGIATAPRLLRFGAEGFGYLGAHFLYLFVLVFIYWSIAQLFIHKRSGKISRAVAYLLISSFLSVIYHRLVGLFYNDFTLLFTENNFFEELNRRQQGVVLFLRGMMFSGIVYVIFFYLKLMEEKQHTQLEIEQLKKEKYIAQLNSLKQQISPHFLFNSLSTLKTLVEDQKSKLYIVQLSNVYRYLLSFNENHLASVKDELNFVESYLFILKERFEDGLQVSVRIGGSSLEKYLPPLVLQLLIENAIKHNIVSLEEPLKIEITESGDGFLVVSNNLQPKSSVEASTGKGINNIINRYKILSGMEVEIAKDNHSFTVKVPLLTENRIVL